MDFRVNRLKKDMAEKTYRMKMVKSKKGWLTIGMIFMALLEKFIVEDFIQISTSTRKISDSVWEADKYNSASICKLGLTPQDVIDRLKAEGQGKYLTGNIYISNRIYKTRADWETCGYEDLLENPMREEALINSIWSKSGDEHLSLISDKNGKIIGWVPYKANLKKSADEYFAEGVRDWY